MGHLVAVHLLVRQLLQLSKKLLHQLEEALDVDLQLVHQLLQLSKKLLLQSEEGHQQGLRALEVRHKGRLM